MNERSESGKKGGYSKANKKRQRIEQTANAQTARHNRSKLPYFL
jgi:hypothetical protein